MQKVTAFVDGIANPVNVQDCATIAQFETLLQQRSKTFTVREEDRSPVYVYMRDKEYVGFYDEEQEHGYIA